MNFIVRVLLMSTIATVFACAGTTSHRKPGPLTVTRTDSPLGLGNPDPEKMFELSLDALERGDLEAYLSYWAFVDRRDGTIFSGNSAKAKEQVERIDALRASATSIRLFSDPKIAVTHYGSVRNIKNTPPIVSVTVTRIYKFSEMTEDQKSRLVGSLNNILPEKTRRLTWSELEASLRAMPKATVMQFVYLEGRWRFLSV